MMPMQRSDGEAIRLSARCQPWLQTPSQLLKKSWVQSECWTNHTPMVYCPPDAWVASSAVQGKPQRRCFAAGEPELIQALRQWRAGSVEAVSSPDAAVASARTGGALPAPKVTKPMTKPPTPRSIVPACLDCAVSERNLGMRPCSKAQERQESFVLDLAAAFGVERGGTFLEVGGNDGMKASNTVHAELCRGWRGILVEANYISFSKLVHNRLGVLGVRGALCERAGSVTFATRTSSYLRRRGVIAPAVDLTGGIESSMGRTFERAGYVSSAPTAWLHRPGEAHRMTVPCVPLSTVLAQAGIERLDVMWLDVEGGERQVLQSIDWDTVSIGILVVEMRYNDAANNRRIISLLRETAGFELVRSLSVWGAKIIDNVFVRPRHFVGANATAMPNAVLSLLRSRPKHSPSHSVGLKDYTLQLAARANGGPARGWRVKQVPGRLCCGPYATTVPTSMLVCTNESEAC